MPQDFRIYFSMKCMDNMLKITQYVVVNNVDVLLICRHRGTLLHGSQVVEQSYSSWIGLIEAAGRVYYIWSVECSRVDLGETDRFAGGERSLPQVTKYLNLFPPGCSIIIIIVIHQRVDPIPSHGHGGGSPVD